jgi:hypothetical protein
MTYVPIRTSGLALVRVTQIAMAIPLVVIVPFAALAAYYPIWIVREDVTGGGAGGSDVAGAVGVDLSVAASGGDEGEPGDVSGAGAGAE